MARRGVRQAVKAVRRMNNATGVPEAQVQDIVGARLGGNSEKYQRVMKRAVTQGYLMRKNNKYYFIPSKSMQLPSLVVMRQRGRRRTRTRRGRTRRRSAGVYLEPVMARTPARRRRRRPVRRRPAGPGAQQQDRPGPSAQSPPLQPKVERKPSSSK